MKTLESRKLTCIGKQTVFKKIIKKLTLGKFLENKEKIYILSCAILFIQTYKSDKRYSSYLDFAYYIILKYSLLHNDYKPLYDFSVNFGFYPISKAILKKNLIGKKIEDILIDLNLEKFRKNDQYIETLEQSKESERFLKDTSLEKLYVAPTSFGKSSIIIDYIKQNKKQKKIGIIVPSKSLLVQTYNAIRKSNLKRKILIHNEMYNKENSFIAVFTQERALRLLNKENTFFDTLIIDEAHNILKGSDSRSILLTRLLNFNYSKNQNQNVIYLSPLIESADSLKLRNGQNISQHIINFNIKEPDFFEYTTKGEIHSFNRFTNNYFKIKDLIVKDKYEYILKNSGEKNFIYEGSPRKIEILSQKIQDNLPKTSKTSKKLKEFKEILAREVSENFYIIESLNVGLVYLHGKLPDIIKEYIEYKFEDIPEIKYIIANTVILE